MSGGVSLAMEPEMTDIQRFELELEFVQSLANPQYLNFLAQRGYFKEKPFVNYLKYLQYWKTKEYSHYLKYPQCLHFLDLLQSDHFLRELCNSQCSKFIEEQQLLHWHLYTKRRMQYHIMAEKQSSSSETSKQTQKMN